MNEFAPLALVGLAVLLFAAKQHRNVAFIAVLCMVLIMGGPSEFAHDVVSAIPGI